MPAVNMPRPATHLYVHKVTGKVHSITPSGVHLEVPPRGCRRILNAVEAKRVTFPDTLVAALEAHAEPKETEL